VKERIVLGMDIGGTKTHAVLANTNGELLGQGFCTAANINFVTLKQAEDALAEAIGQAQKQGGVEDLETEIAIVGIEPDPTPLHSILNKVAKPKKIMHRKEGECSLVGGLIQRTGIALIAGTGSVGWGRNKEGKTHVTSCWGTIGDEGSAYDLARRGVNAAFWATDGRGADTKLCRALCEHFAVEKVIDFVSPIYQNPDVRKNFAALSRVIFRVALEDKDPVAIEVVKEGARQLGLIIATCAEVLNMHTEPYKVAATGGLVSGGGWYFDLIQKDLKNRKHDATMVQPKFKPGIGAAMIGLEEIGVEWNESVVKNMEATMKKIQRN